MQSGVTVVSDLCREENPSFLSCVKLEVFVLFSFPLLSWRLS